MYSLLASVSLMKPVSHFPCKIANSAVGLKKHLDWLPGSSGLIIRKASCCLHCEKRDTVWETLFKAAPHLQPCVEGFGGLQLGILSGVIYKEDVLAVSWHGPVLSCYAPQKGLRQKRRRIHHLLEHILAVLCRQFSRVSVYEYWQSLKRKK